MRGFHWALCHAVWHQEEVEAAINHLRLLYKALVHVGTLWWIVDKGVAVLLRLLEEALADTLIHDDQSYLGQWDLLIRALELAVLLRNDLV